MVGRLTPPQHLWACALEVERQYRAGAIDHCLARIVELEAAGDMDGVRMWQGIMGRVTELADSNSSTT